MVEFSINFVDTKCVRPVYYAYEKNKCGKPRNRYFKKKIHYNKIE